MARFSDRHGYGAEEVPISVREDAPTALRQAIPMIAEECGVGPSTLRSVVCRVLRCVPDSGNWSDPNVWEEAINRIMGCQWYRVYDIAEAIQESLPPRPRSARAKTDCSHFEQELNKTFIEHGIGWQMVGGQILSREPAVVEETVQGAEAALQERGAETALTELQEARLDLSRRPDPDLTGCVQHSMAALECLCKDLSGQPKLTLGEIIKKHSGELGIPKPLDEAIAKAWGYASDVARHVTEGKTPERKEVAMVLGFVASVISYLSEEEK